MREDFYIVYKDMSQFKVAPDWAYDRLNHNDESIEWLASFKYEEDAEFYKHLKETDQKFNK